MNSKIFSLLIIFILIFILVPSITSYSYYNIEIKENDILVNATLGLKSENKVNYWDIVWETPENSTIISIRDSKGSINNYALEKNKLKFKTNSGTKRNKEKVKVILKVKNAIDKRYSPLKILKLSLSGFKNEETEVLIKKNGILSGTFSQGFTEKYNSNEVYAYGKGPVNFKILFSKIKPKYKHFIVFQDYNISKADELFYIIPGVTGIFPPFKYFSVIVLEDSAYNKTVNTWSEGIYAGGGLIFIRKSSMNSERNIATILHEATHGFNEKPLKFDLTDISWFDEGTAKYVEFLVNRKLKIPQAEIFGGDVKFERNNKTYVLKSRGTLEDLWNYYKNGENFMEKWGPRNSENREFGYAYSELFIRKFLRDRNPDSLHKVYQKLLNITEKINDSKKRNEIILNILGEKFKPCYSKNKTEIKFCLKDLEDFSPKIPIVKKLKSSKGKEEFEELNISQNFIEFNNTFEKKQEKTREEIVRKNFWEKILEFFKEILKKIRFW